MIFLTSKFSELSGGFNYHKCTYKIQIVGLAKSRVGIVLVTPALLRRLQGEGIADKELSALLARDLLVPIVHNTTYEKLRDISPLLGSRSGLSTAEESMSELAAKLAELVAPSLNDCAI